MKVQDSLFVAFVAVVFISPWPVVAEGLAVGNGGNGHTVILTDNFAHTYIADTGVERGLWMIVTKKDGTAKATYCYARDKVTKTAMVSGVELVCEPAKNNAGMP